MTIIRNSWRIQYSKKKLKGILRFNKSYKIKWMKELREAVRFKIKQDLIDLDHFKIYGTMNQSSIIMILLERIRKR